MTEHRLEIGDELRMMIGPGEPRSWKAIVVDRVGVQHDGAVRYKLRGARGGTATIDVLGDAVRLIKGDARMSTPVYSIDVVSKTPRATNPEITIEQFYDEFAAQLRKVGIDPCDVHVGMWTAAEERRAKDRDHAYVYVKDLDFRFSKKILGVSRAHREAVMAHEIGHVVADELWGSSTEDEADAAAEQVVGVPICYDKNYSGKGLQVRCSNPSARVRALAERLGRGE